MRRRTRRILIAAGVLAVVLAGLLAPPVRLRLTAAATVADALGLPVLRPMAASVQRRATEVGGVQGDLYDPGGSAPAVILVPGATPAGIRDERVVRAARALARSGPAVFVPELDVYDHDLVRSDVDRIVRAAQVLSRGSRGPVVLMGTSFGGSLCLLAAAEPHLGGRVALVATFGAYFDLVGVAQAATTGVSVVGGDRIPWEADPRADEIVRDRLIGLLPPSQQPALRGALAGDLQPDDLAAGARAVHALLTNRDPRRTFALAQRLPDRIRDRLEGVSPASVADRLTAPVVAMHSTDDPAVPYGELLRLGRAVPHARLLTVDSFSHVDLRATSPSSWLRAADDLRTVLRFATAVLSASGR